MPTSKKSAPKSVKKPAPTAPKKPGRPPKSEGGTNKSAWIRQQDPKLSAKEVVALGKAQGIELTDGFVYTTRSQAKKSAEKKAAGGAAPAPKKMGRPPKSAGASTSKPQGDLEKTIRDLAWKHGFLAIEAIVQKLKSGL